MQKIDDLKGYLSKLKDGEAVYDFLAGITEQTPKGRHDFNKNLYVNVVSCDMQNADDFDGTFENHRTFIDLHVVIQGAEKMFYGDRSDMTVTKEYDAPNDYELLTGKTYSFVEYGRMQGVEFLVNEPHMAGYVSENCPTILKAIVKIRRKRCCRASAG